METFKQILWWFGKALNWTRLIIVNLIFVFVLIIIASAMNSAPKPMVAAKSALLVAPVGRLVDERTYDPNIFSALDDNKVQETVVFDLVRAIELAKDDKQITGIVLRLDFLQQASTSKIEEIGQAIVKFKESGKPVIAHGDILMQHQYLLASYADEIYLHDFGGLYITGFGVYRNYYKDAADKLALKFHVFKAGNYKDAVEPYIETGMSDASREHNSVWLNELWQRYTSIVETQRDLPRGALEEYIENFDRQLADMNGYNAQLALENRLIDGSLSRLALVDKLKEQFGTRKNSDELNYVPVRDYLANPLLALKQSKNKIGLIVATGTIMGGDQPGGTIGSDSLKNLIREASEDEDLSAIVIRVDSGGGSAFASELIREEILKARENGKPVYISMGSVAASGGYWISTAADEIWATPATITGSIGVWSLIPNLTDSFEKLGIYSDGVGTTKLADAMVANRAMAPEVQRVFQASVDNTYMRFLQLVADARESSPEEIDKIAQGRVWAGERALELGLVDGLGSLRDVFDAVAEKQSLDGYSVRLVERPLTPKEEFLRMFSEQAEGLTEQVKSNVFGPLMPLQQDLQNKWQQAGLMDQGMNILATCEECIAP